MLRYGYLAIARLRATLKEAQCRAEQLKDLSEEERKTILDREFLVRIARGLNDLLEVMDGPYRRPGCGCGSVCTPEDML